MKIWSRQWNRAIAVMLYTGWEGSFVPRAIQIFNSSQRVRGEISGPMGMSLMNFAYTISYQSSPHHPNSPSPDSLLSYWLYLPSAQTHPYGPCCWLDGLLFFFLLTNFYLQVLGNGGWKHFNYIIITSNYFHGSSESCYCNMGSCN